MKRLREHAAFKSITGIVLLLAVFSIIVSIIGFNSFTDALLDQYAEGAFLTAETAAQILDADRIDEYVRSNGTTEEYQAIWKRLDQLCNSSGSTFIYLIQPDRSDYAHITFLFSTINHESSYSLYDFGYVRETTNDEYREKYRALYELEADKELVIRDKGYIETDPHITAMIGVKGTDGQVKAILCVQRQMEVMAKVRLTYLQKVTVALIVLALLVIVGQSVFLHRTLLQPLRKISEEATRFSTENVTAGKKLRETIRSKDEIGLLAASIDLMEEQIQSYVENLTKITAEKEHISTELSLASRIQEDMLPNSFPAFPDPHEFDIHASMDPAKEVGGDFYDFFLVDSDHLCMVMADVSGKGIPAALFMMASKIILANNTMLGKSPAKVLMDANTAICSHNREEMFVTVWLGILELSTGKIIAANAGHERPVLMHAGGDSELLNDPHSFAVGGIEGIIYKEYEIQLNPGDKLFLYTDGVPEATNADNKLFGTERMLNALNTVKAASPQGVLKGVRQAVDGFVKDAEQFDDLTMLCVEYRGCEKTENT
ncbi:MAG: SpoIIE family protein phosphatase [Clostridia bacterium]|nr:SpoIIE family protein phosphatase [Clostridia bacterium]